MVKALKVATISICALLCVGCASRRNDAEIDRMYNALENETGFYTYEIDEEKGTSSISSYLDETEEEVVIPESFDYNGKKYPVTSIEDEAFYNNIAITKVTLPDTLQSIGKEAFCMCDALETINIPDSVETLGTGVFYGCSSLKNVTLGKKIVNIPDEFFTNCYALEKLQLPESLTAIGEEVFWSCENLTELELPKSVVSIGDRCFYESGIKTLKILSPAATITKEALSGADEIQEIYVSKSLVKSVSDIVDEDDIKVETLK